MASWKQLEVHTEDQTPHKWSVSLSEDMFKRFFSLGCPVVHKIFGDGSLFSPLLFGKYFDPSDAFPLWEFESDVLLSNLRSSGKTNIDWFQTDDAYVLKADLSAGVENNTVQFFVENGKIMEISGQWKPKRDQSKTKDWRSGNWWEHGYVRRLEIPGDADWKDTEAYVSNDMILEVRIPKSSLVSDTPPAPGKGILAKISDHL
ncbi:21.7 kDa class VI heat shock protein-like [Populus alba x Populus x berolinensis]|uniref:SHSP domain-containing protein n=1 Tax=Populus davidiana TaxID=266767 RepID=A0A6M2EMY6_9ROSI|nr:21.7 kDa class VI heat shock protein-like [Populus alba x Populus x berolinensis]